MAIPFWHWKIRRHCERNSHGHKGLFRKSYCEDWRARNHRCSYYRTICFGAHSGDNQCHVYTARAHYEAYLKCHAHTSCPKRSSPKKRFFTYASTAVPPLDGRALWAFKWIEKNYCPCPPIEHEIYHTKVVASQREVKEVLLLMVHF